MFQLNKGFTLIEVLVSMSIITTFIFAPLAIISEHLIQNSLTQKNVEGRLLAQEIIEIVRFSRDSHIKNENETLSWFEEVRKIDNVFSPCIVNTNDFADGLNEGDSYCLITKNEENCSSFIEESENCISGEDELDVKRTIVDETTETCDGGEATTNFTTTLSLVLPNQRDQLQYAIVNSCVSWKENDNTDTVKKIEFRETFFEWLKR